MVSVQHCMAAITNSNSSVLHIRQLHIYTSMMLIYLFTFVLLTVLKWLN